MSIFGTTCPKRSVRAPLILAALGLLLAEAPAAALQAHPLPPDDDDAWLRLETTSLNASWVGVDTGGADTVSTWLVRPDRSDPAPVVLIVQEAAGVTEWTQAVAVQLADHGFLAVVPDLLSGKVPGGGRSQAVPEAEAVRLTSGLTWSEVRRRIDAVAGYAAGLPEGRNRLGIVGFGWGGEQAFRYATERTELDAAVIFYGAAPDSAAAAKIRTPLLALYGGNDAQVNATVEPLLLWREKLEKRREKQLAKIERLEEKGKEHEKEPDPLPWLFEDGRFEHRLHGGAGHGFLRFPSRAASNQRAAGDAWPRTIRFLRAHLGG